MNNREPLSLVVLFSGHFWDMSCSQVSSNFNGYGGWRFWDDLVRLFTRLPRRSFFPMLVCCYGLIWMLSTELGCHPLLPEMLAMLAACLDTTGEDVVFWSWNVLRKAHRLWCERVYICCVGNGRRQLILGLSIQHCFFR